MCRQNYHLPPAINRGKIYGLKREKLKAKIQGGKPSLFSSFYCFADGCFAFFFCHYYHHLHHQHIHNHKKMSLYISKQPRPIIFSHFSPLFLPCDCNCHGFLDFLANSGHTITNDTTQATNGASSSHQTTLWQVMTLSFLLSVLFIQEVNNTK